jgi:hypothetical protein
MMDSGYYVAPGMGIGKTVPETELHVGGDVTIDGALLLPAVSEADSSTTALVIEGGIVKYSNDISGGGGSTKGEVDIEYSAEIQVDVSAGFVFNVVLAGNPEIVAPINYVAGDVFILRLYQDATGNRTVTWNSVFRFSGDIEEPTLSTGANEMDSVGFIWNAKDSVWDVVGLVQGF